LPAVEETPAAKVDVLEPMTARVVAVALVVVDRTAKRLTTFNAVAEAVEANRLVLVVLVPVALTHTMFEEVTLVNTPVDGVMFPITVPLIDPPRIVALLELRLRAVRVVAEATKT